MAQGTGGIRWRPALSIHQGRQADAIEPMVRKYATSASAACASLIGKRVSPDVREVAERLWPWARGTTSVPFSRTTLPRQRSLELVAYRISRYLKLHPGD